MGLSMIFTSVMMVAMPAAARLIGLDVMVGGAWLGGTIDATGAVRGQRVRSCSGRRRVALPRRTEHPNPRPLRAWRQRSLRLAAPALSTCRDPATSGCRHGHATRTFRSASTPPNGMGTLSPMVVAGAASISRRSPLTFNR